MVQQERPEVRRAPDLAVPPANHCGGDTCRGHLCTEAGCPPGAPRPPGQLPGARSRPPARGPPPTALQGGVSSSAHCSLPSARPAPAPPGPAAAAAGALLGRGGVGRGRGGGRRGRDGSRRGCWRGRSRADAAQDAAAAAAALPLAPRPSPALRQLRRERAAERDSRVPDHRRAAGATARPPRAAPTLPPPGRTDAPSASPAATCSRPGGEDTMRSALALSAVLLLLLPPPSLFDNAPTSQTNDKSDGATKMVSATTITPGSTIVTTKTAQQSTAQTTPSTVTATARDQDTNSPAASSGPVGTTTPDEASTQRTLTTTAGGPTVVGVSSRPTFASSTVPTKPETTKGVATSTDSGAHSDPIVTTGPATEGESHTTVQPTPGVNTLKSASALPPATNPANSHPLTNVTSEPFKSSPTGQHPPATALSSAGTVVGLSHTFPPDRGPTTQSSVATVQETQQASSQRPVIPVSSSEAVSQQHTSVAPGTMASTPVRTPTRTSPKLASTAPEGPSRFPTLAFGRNKISCGSPEKPNEDLLILNFTRTSLCVSSSSDDNLVTILCQAAKATFNPAHDDCNVVLVPVPESQAVAVKEIVITTKLLPKDIYEQLKDKWDDLKEAGVSHMQLGDQGPPEETEDRFSMPLIITIVCMASFLLLVAALYGCCHQRLSQRKDQQRLTEELQTVENGYHDNPTLEVMETSSEMQEKKVVNLNGELGDSWIVPLDNLTKDDLDEEEDTHL
ncbi:podocalyxin isoform X3 [Nycticebus coucang]|uniref:podocalyxin isoform X3 n=1 Tax=Nycticebus coucang TaxID=9470 RepID=UPI00234C46CD|nr:podocalyxin isoform X3 [Nycticebus coucang]